MQRNSDRLGLGDQHLPATSEAPPASGGDFVAPTGFAELPSKGKFYPEGHPLKDKEDVEYRFMTAKQEDLLTNKTLIKKGTVIDRMIQSVLVDGKLNLDTILLGDKNSLIAEIRISGYGSDYMAKMICANCGEAVQHKFDLEKAKRAHYGIADGVIQNENGEEVITNITSDGQFSLVLPKTKATVTCRLLTGADEKQLMAISEMKKKNKLAESAMTDQMKQFVTSVNGKEDKAAIASFIDGLPVLDSRYLREWYRKASPNLTLVEEFTCATCGFEEEVPVPLGVEFFGLSDAYIRSVYEQFFYLKYYGGFSLYESYNLPVIIRDWFFAKLNKQIGEENEARKSAKPQR
jgi:hypothetical protein